MIVLLQGPRRGLFHMSEIPCSTRAVTPSRGRSLPLEVAASPKNLPEPLLQRKPPKNGGKSPGGGKGSDGGKSPKPRYPLLKGASVSMPAPFSPTVAGMCPSPPTIPQGVGFRSGVGCRV